MRYDIKVDASEVHAVLNAILRAPAQTRRIVSGRLQRQIKRWAEQEVSNYPPERPGQTYERTGTLRENWDVHVSTQGEALAVEISNDATGPDGRAYAVYVIGERQAWFHVGRWTDGDEAINDYLDDVGNEYVRTYLDVLREGSRS
jgi:hypothetical protein